MMVGGLLYAYARGLRSSRKIERACVEDVAFRVIAANQAPDHTTIARFRQRHEAALAGLFGEVLELCAEAGLVEVGVVAIDGTKLHANASQERNRATRRSRGRSSLRPTRSTRGGRALRRGPARGCAAARVPQQRWPQGLVARGKAEARRAPGRGGRAIPDARPDGCGRQTPARGGPGRRAPRGRAPGRGLGRRGARARPAAGRRPRPYLPPATPAGEINVSDPDSRRLKGPRGYLQGYNAQAAVTERQIVIAAELNADTADFGHLEPMVTAARDELERAGVADTPGWSSPTPATGTRSTWRRSWAAASR